MRDVQTKYQDAQAALLKREADFKFGQEQVMELRERLHQAEVQVQAYAMVSQGIKV